MKQKYTIVIEPELHDWFAHRAIDVNSNISALIMDAMKAYMRTQAQKNRADTSQKISLVEMDTINKIPEAVKKPYVKKIYHQNTKTLNDTPRAREVSKVATKILSLLKKAKSPGLRPSEIDNLLGMPNVDLGIRRDALVYLKDNAVIKRNRDYWVHAHFEKRSRARSKTPRADTMMQG